MPPICAFPVANRLTTRPLAPLARTRSEVVVDVVVVVVASGEVAVDEEAGAVEAEAVVGVGAVGGEGVEEGLARARSRVSSHSKGRKSLLTRANRTGGWSTQKQTSASPFD